MPVGDEPASIARRHADACAEFIRAYGALADVAPASFLSDDHWSALLSPAARAQLDALSLEQLRKLALLSVAAPAERPARPPAAPVALHIICDVPAFFTGAGACRLAGLAVELDALCASRAGACADGEWSSQLRKHRALLAHKKAHEVGRVARAVQWLAADGPVRVVDVGSGKGYLGSFLSVGLGIQTVSVEGSALITAGAAKRHANVSRLFRNAGGQHELRTAWLAQAAPAGEFDPGVLRSGGGVAESAGERGDDGADGDARAHRTVLTGLHACGDLTTTAIGAFVNRSDLWGLVCVGCCYHLMADGAFPASRHMRQRELHLSRHLRMLASKALERELRPHADAAATADADAPDRTLWRPMLTLVLRDSLGVDVRARHAELQVGRVAHRSASWVAYARAALAQLGFDPDAVCETELLELERRCSAHDLLRVKKLEVLRLALAPAVEAAIALDRLLHVLESGQASAAWIVRMFDARESPRCLGIVCHR